jgi:hypothetical protein
MQSLTIYHHSIEHAIDGWIAEKLNTKCGSEKTEKAYRETITSFRQTLQRGGLDLDTEETHTVTQVAAIWAALRVPARRKSDGTESRRFAGEVSPATYNQRLTIVFSFYAYLQKQAKLLGRSLRDQKTRLKENAHMEPSDYHLPPTHPVSPSGGSELTQPAPPPLWYDIPPIPPPPPPEPKRRKHRWSIAGFIVLLLGIVSMAIFAEWAGIQPTSHVRPTPTSRATQMVPSPTVPTLQPTIDPNYTANDIVTYLHSVDRTVAIESTNEAVWDWSHRDYPVSVQATSSVQFIGCPIGDCADAWHFGIWVYATPQDAEIAYQQVYSDSQSCVDTSSHADGMYVVCGFPEQEYAHGRCLLLNAVASSVYGQVVTQKCI